jgi:hypothetical protein
MGHVYKKSLKGIDEVAFKTNGLPLRLASYLLAVDGIADTDELAARHPQLPSMAAVLQGLVEQGYLEVNATTQTAAGRTPVQAANYLPPSMQNQAPPAPPVRQAPPGPSELDIVKSNMVRDVSSLLGSDADMVITKIQKCMNKDDLFVAMMGIKKIITMYRDKNVAEKFGSRYESLSR